MSTQKENEKKAKEGRRKESCESLTLSPTLGFMGKAWMMAGGRPFPSPVFLPFSISILIKRKSALSITTNPFFPISIFYFHFSHFHIFLKSNFPTQLLNLRKKNQIKNKNIWTRPRKGLMKLKDTESHRKYKKKHSTWTPTAAEATTATISTCWLDWLIKNSKGTCISFPFYFSSNQL